jgi:hypothetical protein
MVTLSRELDTEAHMSGCNISVVQYDVEAAAAGMISIKLSNQGQHLWHCWFIVHPCPPISPIS